MVLAKTDSEMKQEILDGTSKGKAKAQSLRLVYGHSALANMLAFKVSIAVQSSSEPLR